MSGSTWQGSRAYRHPLGGVDRQCPGPAPKLHEHVVVGAVTAHLGLMAGRAHWLAVVDVSGYVVVASAAASASAAAALGVRLSTGGFWLGKGWRLASLDPGARFALGRACLATRADGRGHFALCMAGLATRADGRGHFALCMAGLATRADGRGHFALCMAGLATRADGPGHFALGM